MELIALWKFFLRRWWLIVLPPLVVLVFVAPALLQTPGGGWMTVLHFSAAQPPEIARPTYEDSSYYPWVASEHVIDNLTTWVRTSSFAEEISRVLAERGIDIPPDAMRGIIASDNAFSVMQVFIYWPDADELRAIGEAAIEVLQHRSQAYFPQFAVQPAQVVALDDIALTPTSPPLLNRFQPLFKVVLAGLAGLGLAALVEYLDDSIHSRDDLEALGLPVLGEIPRHKNQF